MDMEQKPLYAPLREGKDFAVWPLYPACNGNCNQGRACDCAADTDEEDMHDGMGVIVVPLLILSAAAVSAVILAALGWL